MPLGERVGRVLDTESVRHYQTLVYCAYIIAGVHALWVGALPNAVGQTLGVPAHIGWVALIIGGPLLTFAGMWLEARHVAGLWFQIAGDAGVAFASATYVAALSQTLYAGRATFAMWVVLALALSALALVVRGVRKVRAVAVVVRRLDGE